MAEKLTKNFLFSGFGIDQLFWSSIKLGSAHCLQKEGEDELLTTDTVQMKKEKQARKISCGKLRPSQVLQVKQ